MTPQTLPTFLVTRSLIQHARSDVSPTNIEAIQASPITMVQIFHVNVGMSVNVV